MADNKIKIPFPPIDEARKEASLQKIHREISHKSLPVPVRRCCWTRCIISHWNTG